MLHVIVTISKLSFSAAITSTIRWLIVLQNKKTMATPRA